MKKANLLAIITTVAVISIIISGCDSFIPVNPGKEYDEENTVLQYLKVIPGNVEMTVNQSQKFTVKAYNSDHRLIAIDISQVQWVAVYQCLSCGKVWTLSPTRGSLQTTFTPLKTGNYKIWVNYQEKWAKAEIKVK